MFSTYLLSGRIHESAVPLVLLLLFGSLCTRSVAAFSPFDNYEQNVGIYATLSSGDLASSQPTFVSTQAPAIKLDYLWINCGINNEGPTASIRVYISLASDSIVVYFEFKQVYPLWHGVVSGKVNYKDWLNPGDAWLDPSGASGGTGVAVSLTNDLVYAAGGGFWSIVRVWAEGARVQVYAGECQYGIVFENAQISDILLNRILNPTILTGISALAVATVTVFLIRKGKVPHRSRFACPRCGWKNPKKNFYCVHCGNTLMGMHDKTRMY